MDKYENDYEPSKFEIPRIEKKLGDVKNSEKNYEEAITHYKNSIMALKILFDEEISLAEDEKKATDLIDEVGIPVHLNLAYCFLQLEDWRNVIFYCNKVLELNPDQLKAIYRRCKAYLKIKELDKAKEDLDKLQEKLKNSDELMSLKEIYEKLESEKSKEGIYHQIGKKYLNNKNPSTKEEMFEVHAIKPYIRRIIDLILRIFQIVTSMLLLSVDRSIKIPFMIALNITKKAKRTFIDIPVGISTKLINLFVMTPARYIINKFNPFK